MKNIIICFLLFAVGLYSSALQAQILSAGSGTEFSIGAGTMVSADSLELTPAALYTISNNTLSKSNIASNSTSIIYINKVYQFSATTASYSGALKMYYNNTQLNGLTASGLKLLIHNGSSWSLDNNSSSTTSSNVVVNNSVSGVSLREITAGACSPNTGDTTATAFDSFVWYGVTYTASATPTQTFTNVGGCDSVVTLHLTINTQNFFTRCNATWSKQNLDVTTYNDGTPIPQVTDFSTLYSMQTGAWMYYNNIPGPNKLYNWYAVAGIYNAQSLNNPTLRKQIAPTGWRVPTDSEWNKLTKCFDANADTSCLNCNASSTAGDSLKNIGLVNAYGGSCDYGGCGNLNIWQNYWTSSSYDGAYALARYVNNYEPNLQRYIQYAEKYHGFSVPLIQDLTSTGDTTATACGSFVWYGQTYSTSGTPTHTFTNANGYDSLVTLHLTINAIPTPTFTSSPSTTCLNTDVTYTTQSGQASYSWMVAGTAGVDYSITSGGLSSSSYSVTLKWLTAGSKNVNVNYTDQNGCTGGGIDIPTNGLVGYWPFTGNANDVSGGGHNGDLRGTTLPALITDRHGNSNSAYAFTAGGTIPNHIYVGRNVLSNFSQMAVSLWFKTSSTTLSLPLSSGNNNEYNIQINPNGKILTGTFHCNNGTVTNGGYVSTESSNAYNDNSWHHAVLVYDGSFNKLYVDGVFNSQVQNTSGTTTPGCASNANYSDLSFSSYYLYGDYYPLSSTEDLDDIAIYNRPLSANEVADLYNAQNSEIIGGATSTTTVSITNTGDTTASACGSFVWYGVAYTSSATPSHTFTNASGCDSVVTLNLTINTPTTSTETVAACLSYTWNGVTYSTSGTRTWNGTNAAGCDSVATLILTISKANVYPPFGVTQTVISNVCSSRVYRYTASVAPVGTIYNWILPNSIGGVNGITVDSGDINSSRTLLVRYTSNEAAFATDSIKVRSFNGGCTSAYRAVKLSNIKLSVPTAPTSITVTSVGANICSNRTYRFTAPALPAGTNSSNSTILPATGYLWSFVGSLSEFATIDSGDENSQKIVVSFSSNAAAVIGDSVKLQYLSSCGNSKAKSLKLSNTKLSAPAAPTTITITALQTNVCGARKYRYTAPNLPAATTNNGAATGYVWSLVGALSNTATIDSGEVNSQKIVVTFTSNVAAAAGDSIRLYYTSNCGNGSRKASKLTNTLLGAPSAPATITIQTKSDVCNVRTYRYIAPAVLPSATTLVGAATGYLWSTPTGTVGSTGTIDSGEVNSRIITVTYSSNAAATTGDSIRLRYTSLCGDGKTKAQKLSNLVKTGCVSPITKNTSTSRVPSTLPTSMEVNVYPNPTTSQFNVQVKSSSTEAAVVRVLDFTGRFIKRVKLSSNSNVNLGSDLKAGAYMLEVKQGKEVKMVRVVKF
jgi:uncharacterized protein (TIGR02145 family)